MGDPRAGALRFCGKTREGQRDREIEIGGNSPGGIVQTGRREVAEQIPGSSRGKPATRHAGEFKLTDSEGPASAREERGGAKSVEHQTLYLEELVIFLLTSGGSSSTYPIRENPLAFSPELLEGGWPAETL